MYLYHQKKNLWSDRWCFLAVSNKSFVVFTVNILKLNGKSFFRCQKDLRLIYLWASVALAIWLVFYWYHHKWICRVTGDVILVFPVKVLLYSFLTCYFFNGKSFFRSQKDHRLIYLWASEALEIWLVMYLYHHKWICRVTGDVFFVCSSLNTVIFTFNS